METPLLVYLSIENQFKRKCIEDLILNHFDQHAKIQLLNHSEEILDANFEEKNWKQIFFIVDCNSKEITNVRMLNLNKDHPNLKTLVFVDKFDYNKIKLLFNIGVKGVLDKGISPDDFVEIFTSVTKGDLAITPNFQKELLAEFCQNDKRFQTDKNSTENQQNSLSDDKLADSFEELFALTKREKEILLRVCNGQNTKEISDELFISLHTAETHRRNILSKLNAKNTAEMVKFAMKYNLIN